MHITIELFCQIKRLEAIGIRIVLIFAFFYLGAVSVILRNTRHGLSAATTPDGMS